MGRGAEQLYSLSAVAGRRQDDRPSIRTQNKVKRLPSIPDPIPVHVNPPEILLNGLWRRGGNLVQMVKTPFNPQPFLAVSRLMELIATTNREGTPSQVS